MTYAITVHMQERKRLYTAVLKDHLRHQRQMAFIRGPLSERNSGFWSQASCHLSGFPQFLPENFS